LQLSIQVSRPRNQGRVETGNVHFIETFLVQEIPTANDQILFLFATASENVAPPQKKVFMPKSVVKHEHTLVRFMTQQLALLTMRTGLTGTVKIRVSVRGL
jgi:hypothetical protein